MSIKNDPCRNIIFGFHQGMSVGELAVAYDTDSLMIESILRLAFLTRTNSLKRIMVTP